MFSIQPLVPIACLSLSYLLNKSQFRLPIHLLISDAIKSHIPLPYLSDNVIIPYLQSSLNPVLSIAVMLHSASSLHHASYGIVNVFSITPPKSLFIPSCPLFSHSFCNARGACLVTSLTADDGTMKHDLVVIVLGTEDSIERGRVSGLLARYALNTFYMGMGEPESGADTSTAGNLPTHAEAAVNRILQTAGKH